MDDVRTGNGRLKIDFIDGSELRVTEQSQILIDEFVFDPDPDKGKMAVSFLSGTARFATSKSGKINKNNIAIQTPTAQISVRGTDFTITVDETGRSLVILLPDDSGLPSGEILVATGAGSVVLNKPFQSTVAHLFEQSPTAPVILDLTIGMIDSMLIVSPPQEVSIVDNTTSGSDRFDSLDSGELDTDFLETPREPDQLDFNGLDVDLLTDIMDQLIEKDKKEESSRTNKVEIKGTAIGTDDKTGFTTSIQGNQLLMSRSTEGEVYLILDSTNSYNISFNLNGQAFNISVNGGNSNTINIRQSK